jgi:hypothetical protein
VKVGRGSSLMSRHLKIRNINAIVCKVIINLSPALISQAPVYLTISF